MKLIAVATFLVFLLVVAALPYLVYRPQPLQASATGTPRTGPTPLTVFFVGSASGGSGLLRFSWDFGDGTGSSEANPSHTYLFPGTYNATLQVSDLREARLTPAILINSTTTRFDFRDNLTAAKPERYVRGVATSAFMIEGRGNASSLCSVKVSNASVYQGDCASFLYVYKTKRSAAVQARFDVNISVRRNATDASVSITLTGELSSNYQTTFDVHEATTGLVRDARLDAAGQAGVPSQAAYQATLTAGSSKTYIVRVDGGLWVNVSANVTIQYKIQEEVTTVVGGDCRQVSTFIWVRQSETLSVEVNITIAYVAASPNSTARVTVGISGSFQVVASKAI